MDGLKDCKMPETTMICFILLSLVKTDQKLFVLVSLFNSQRSEENVSKEPPMKAWPTYSGDLETHFMIRLTKFFSSKQLIDSI